MSHVKTNAMRILDSNNIKYSIITYDTKDKNIDGLSVAKKINRKPAEVFKTLVTQGNTTEIMYLYPVAEELNLKRLQGFLEKKRYDSR